MSIIKYNLKGVPVNNKTLIHRALYGYIDHSNKGNYTYHREGILKSIKHTKIGNSVLMMNTKDVKQLIPLFKKYKIRANILDMIMRLP